jgi:phosphatidylserine/phosphatidylglycerophosphate/cardiolipin synthase-like enzyme
MMEMANGIKVLFAVLIFTSLQPSFAESSQAIELEAPRDEEVCFSPMGSCAEKLVQFIRSAKKSVDVAIYDINQVDVVHELVVQANKIRVRVIVDRRQIREEHSAVPTLIRAGLDVRYGRQRGIFHNKFTVVDDKRVETGSFNYTQNASENNSENQVYLASPAIVGRYEKHFDELWKKAIPVKP